MTTESKVYDWYGVKTVAATETGDARKHRPDYRLPASGHELVCRCSANLKTSGHYEQPQGCKYYKKSQYHEGSYGKGVCVYNRFNIMCDKVTDSEGKEIN